MKSRVYCILIIFKQDADIADCKRDLRMIKNLVGYKNDCELKENGVLYCSFDYSTKMKRLRDCNKLGKNEGKYHSIQTIAFVDAFSMK